MDKQFLRILMLSVLLPAGAAVAEAFQHEHLSFHTADQTVMAKLVTAPASTVERRAAVEKVSNTTSKTEKQDQKQDPIVAQSEARDSETRP